MYLNVGCTVLTCELHCSWLGNPVLNTGHLIFLFFGFLLRTPCCATDKAPFELELVIFFGFVIGFGSFSGGLGTGFDSNLPIIFQFPLDPKSLISESLKWTFLSAQFACLALQEPVFFW